MLYTRKGDSGQSGLYGTDQRLSKDSAIFEALGTLDELNSLLGFCRAYAVDKIIHEDILQVQQALFIVQAELAGSDKKIKQEHVDALEKRIDTIEATIESPRAFVISGATQLSSLLDFARAVSRRAERNVVAAMEMKDITPELLAYHNRLSSLLYALARSVATSEGKDEPSPTYT